MKSKKYFQTMFFAGLCTVVNYLISFCLTNYITENMGADVYGFVSLAKTISNYAIVFTSCLNAYAARYITLSYHRKDFKKSSVYYSSVFFANLFLSAIVILVSVFVVAFLDKLLYVPPEILGEVRVLFLLDFINYMILATGTGFTVYGYAKNRLDVLNLIKCGGYISEAIVLVVLFAFLPDSIAFVGVGLLTASVVMILGNLKMTRKLMPELHIKSSLCRLKAIKDLVFSGIWNSVNSIGNLLQSGLDLIVSNLMLSAMEMGQLSIVKTLSTMFTTLFQIVSSAFQPQMLKCYSNNDTDELIKTLKQAIKTSGFFSALLFAGLIAFGKDYYRLWTPNQDIDVLYILTLITVAGSLIDGIVYPLFYVYTLTLKNKVPCFVTILSGLLNVLGMYVLIKTTSLRLNAVVLTTSVLAWGTYLVFTPLYTSACLKIKKSTFYPTILRVVFFGIVLMGLAECISLIPIHNSWLTLIVRALLVTIIAVPTYCILVFGLRDTREVINKFRKMVKR